MNKAKISILVNGLVFIACLAELQDELSNGFEGIKAHHGLIIYSLSELVMHIKELLEARENFKEAKEKK